MKGNERKMEGHGNGKEMKGTGKMKGNERNENGRKKWKGKWKEMKEGK